MRILMIAEKDAANISLGKIAGKYLEKGHGVVVYAMYYEPRVLHYFDPQIPRYPLSSLSDDEVDACDCIFASTVAVGGVVDARLFSAHKPIFTQRYIIDGTINWGGDMCFLPSLETAASEYGDNVQYSRVGIGEPKYDEENLTKEVENRLLFIDSGHYPFGEEGKRELARTLLKICGTYADYELWIKPRFLPGDKIITHQNMRHLYDVLEEEADGDIPQNLVLLREHQDLKELIDASHTVICMFTSAFVGACVSGKGLIVLDRLPSEDVYDVRLKHFNYTRDCIKPSGALVDYREIYPLLPHGVKCSEEYLDYLLAEQEDVCEKICEVTEYLCRKFYSKGKFPCQVECSYKDFYQQIETDETMTWNKLVSERFLDCLAYKLLTLISFRINATLDVGIIREHLRSLKSKGLMTEKLFMEELESFPRYRDECIIANQNRMLVNDIDSGILLNALYQLHKVNEIKLFPRRDVGAYHLYHGLVAYDEGEMDIAIAELRQYVEKLSGRAYVKEISDMSNNRMRAFRILIEGLVEQKNSDSEIYLAEMKNYYNSLYSWTDEVIDKNQARQYEYLKWCENKIQELYGEDGVR